MIITPPFTTTTPLDPNYMVLKPITIIHKEDEKNSISCNTQYIRMGWQYYSGGKTLNTNCDLGFYSNFINLRAL